MKRNKKNLCCGKNKVAVILNISNIRRQTVYIRIDGVKNKATMPHFEAIRVENLRALLHLLFSFSFFFFLPFVQRTFRQTVDSRQVAYYSLLFLHLSLSGKKALLDTQTCIHRFFFFFFFYTR